MLQTIIFKNTYFGKCVWFLRFVFGIFRIQNYVEDIAYAEVCFIPVILLSYLMLCGERWILMEYIIPYY